jgi:hypothetical protein
MSGSGVTFDHPAAEAVAGMVACLDALAAANAWSLPAGELARLLVDVEVVARRLDAARVDLAAQAESSGVAEHEGATSLPALLRARADVAPRATKERLWLHAALGGLPVAREAFAAGEISQSGAAAVCTAMASLPPQLPARLTSPVEQLLVDVAAEEGTAAVSRRAMEITHRFAPDELARREARAAERDRFRLVLRHDGGISFTGSYGVEAAARILPVLDAYAAPRPAADGVPDMRDAETRYAEAFVQVCQAAGAHPNAPWRSGEPPHVNVTISLEALRGELGQLPGVLDHGAVLSAEATRRLACDAKVIPVVLGSAGEPLDVGRATRCWPIAIRRAIEARDQGCAMPGCERPPAWCDVHHRKHWADGGHTCADNGVLLCGRHHAIVHRDGWLIELLDGKPWFTPPTWIDARRTPRLHSRFKTRQLDDP